MAQKRTSKELAGLSTITCRTEHAIFHNNRDATKSAFPEVRRSTVRKPRTCWLLHRTFLSHVQKQHTETSAPRPAWSFRRLFVIARKCVDGFSFAQQFFWMFFFGREDLAFRGGLGTQTRGTVERGVDFMTVVRWGGKVTLV